jgi:hypothetical protein
LAREGMRSVDGRNKPFRRKSKNSRITSQGGGHDGKNVSGGAEYCETKACADAQPPAGAMGWKEMYLKEDWWAIYLGLGIVVAAIASFHSGGSSIKLLGVLPPAWTNLAQLGDHFATHIGWYFLQFVVWIVIFGISTSIMGFKQSEYIPSFMFLYVLSIITFIIGQFKPITTLALKPLWLPFCTLNNTAGIGRTR